MSDQDHLTANPTVGGTRQVSNPIPGMGDLSVSEDGPSRERRLYSEAAAARAAATPAEIEARGIKPNVKEIVESMNKGLELEAEDDDQAKLPARKIYKTASFDDFLGENGGRYVDDSDSDSEVDEPFIREWVEATNSTGGKNVDPGLFCHYYRLARASSLKIDAALAEHDGRHRLEAEVVPARKFDLIGSMSTCTELLIELGKYLPPKDIVKLYSISRDFHHTLTGYMQSCVIAWVRYKAPKTAPIYINATYNSYFVPDPAGRWRDKAAHDMSYLTRPELQRPVVRDKTVRRVPGLRWLQMVCHREVCVRDIVATLARNGHRLPPGTSMTLKKIGVLMDTPSSRRRSAAIGGTAFFTDEDLVRAQIFFIKLDMLFNDPVLGPGSSMLTSLMLGQRSLSTLWEFLRGKAYKDKLAIRQLKLRYDVGASHEMLERGLPVDGVSLHEMGVGHFEGWGAGNKHLLRPDELVPMEAARRQLELDLFSRWMMVYGHVDVETGASLVPSLSEMYMSDDDLPDVSGIASPIHAGCGNVPFERHMWQPKHARKARWSTLPPQEKQMILDEERQDIAENWGDQFTEEKFKEFATFFEKSMRPYLGENGREKYHRTRLPKTSEDEEEETEEEEEDEEEESSGDDGASVGGEPENAPPPADLTPLGYQRPRTVSSLAGWQAGRGGSESPSSSRVFSGRQQIQLHITEEESEEDGEMDNTDGTGSEGEDQEGDEEVESFESVEDSEDSEDSEGHEEEGEEEEDDLDGQDLETLPAPLLSDDLHTTLDEHLISQADTAYDEDDMSFDWEAYAHKLSRRSSSSANSQDSNEARALGDRVREPSPETYGEGEDLRVEWLRDHYRNW